MTFLGIELDYSHMSIRLPGDMLTLLNALISSFSDKVSASKCQLQSLASLSIRPSLGKGGRGGGGEGGEEERKA